MRVKTKIIALFLLAATPAFAQTTVPVLEDDGNGSQMLDPQSFDVALLCTSALQIAALAAPDWANEPAVSNASNLWLARTHAMAPKNGIAGNEVNNAIKAKMRELTNLSIKSPDYLNNLMFECAVNSPN